MKKFSDDRVQKVVAEIYQEPINEVFQDKESIPDSVSEEKLNYVHKIIEEDIEVVEKYLKEVTFDTKSFGEVPVELLKNFREEVSKKPNKKSESKDFLKCVKLYLS